MGPVFRKFGFVMKRMIVATIVMNLILASQVIELVTEISSDVTMVDVFHQAGSVMEKLTVQTRRTNLTPVLKYSTTCVNQPTSDVSLVAVFLVDGSVIMIMIVRTVRMKINALRKNTDLAPKMKGPVIVASVFTAVNGVMGMKTVDYMIAAMKCIAIWTVMRPLNSSVTFLLIVSTRNGSVMAKGIVLMEAMKTAVPS